MHRATAISGGRAELGTEGARRASTCLSLRVVRASAGGRAAAKSTALLCPRRPRVQQPPLLTSLQPPATVAGQYRAPHAPATLPPRRSTPKALKALAARPSGRASKGKDSDCFISVLHPGEVRRAPLCGSCRRSQGALILAARQSVRVVTPAWRAKTEGEARIFGKPTIFPHTCWILAEARDGARGRRRWVATPLFSRTGRALACRPDCAAARRCSVALGRDTRLISLISSVALVVAAA